MTRPRYCILMADSANGRESMELDINWLAVGLAALVAMAVPMVWYSNWGLFAKAWEKQTGVTSEKLKDAQGRKPFLILFAVNIVTTLVLALAIAIASAYFEDTSLWLALATGFMLWLGLSATTLLQHNTFEMKSGRLTVINSAYQLALFMAIALIIGLFL